MAECWDNSTENDEVSGQIKAIWCQPCLKKYKQTKAEKCCSTCDEFQCLDCLQGHFVYSFMKGHKLVNVNEAEPRQISFDMKGLDRCNKHQELYKFFCEDEDELCCTTCAIVDHRKCNSVVEVQKVVEKSATTSSNIKVKLQNVKQKAEMIIDSVVSSKEKMGDDVKAIPVRIRKMRDEVIKMFDGLEFSVGERTESFEKETSEKLTKQQSQNEKYLADIQSCIDTVDNVYQSGTSVQQFIIEHKMQKEVNVIQTNVDEEYKGLVTVTVKFDFDETLKLPPHLVADFVPGKLTMSLHQLEELSIKNSDNTKMKLTPIISVDLKQGDYNIKQPLYTGIDFLPDGRLVAVDNSNKKCVVYDEKLEMVGSYQLSYHPKSVVVVSEQEVAITSGDEFTLDILRVNKYNGVILDRTYKVTTKYFSICLKDSKHFLVGTIDHSTPVRILSFKGEETDFDINFPKKTYAIDTSVCTYIRNSEKVVLADSYDHTVYIYDINTNTRVVVKDDRIKKPRGVALGPYDTILVCCNKTKSIIQISQTGQILSTHKIDIANPRSICVSRDKRCIVVTNNHVDMRKIQKFTISH